MLSKIFVKTLTTFSPLFFVAWAPYFDAEGVSPKLIGARPFNFSAAVESCMSSGDLSSLTFSAAGDLETAKAPLARLSQSGSSIHGGRGSWNTFSDVRLKDKNSFRDFRYGLEELNRLQLIHYNYSQDNELGLDSDKTHIGFIAQDLQKVIPEAVSIDESNFLEINNETVVWTVLNAVKELSSNSIKSGAGISARLNYAESQVALIRKQSEERISKLEAKNKKLEKELSDIRFLLLENIKVQNYKSGSPAG